MKMMSGRTARVDNPMGLPEKFLLGIGSSKALFAAVLLTFATTDVGASETALPPYHPDQKVSGTIRTWGHGSLHKDYIGGLVRSWEAGFQRFQPQVKFEDK